MGRRPAQPLQGWRSRALRAHSLALPFAFAARRRGPFAWGLRDHSRRAASPCRSFSPTAQALQPQGAGAPASAWGWAAAGAPPRSSSTQSSSSPTCEGAGRRRRARRAPSSRARAARARWLLNPFTSWPWAAAYAKKEHGVLAHLLPPPAKWSRARRPPARGGRARKDPRVHEGRRRRAPPLPRLLVLSIPLLHLFASSPTTGSREGAGAARRRRARGGRSSSSPIPHLALARGGLPFSHAPALAQFWRRRPWVAGSGREGERIKYLPSEVGERRVLLLPGGAGRPRPRARAAAALFWFITPSCQGGRGGAAQARVPRGGAGALPGARRRRPGCVDRAHVGGGAVFVVGDGRRGLI